MIIITAKAHPCLEEGFIKAGFKVLYQPDITYEELLVLISSATGIVVTTRLKIDRAIIDRAENLQWIGRLGSGLELIDTAYAEARSIRCVSTPEGNRNAVGEHALGMLLNVMNNITRSAIEVKNGIWERNENRGTELSGKTVGLVGYGNTGGAFAKLLACFDVTILAYDKYKTGFGDHRVREASFEQLCRYSDVISFHVPLTNETEAMADAAFFDALVQKPVLLNTSRGKVIDFGALVAALRKGQLSAVALDVLENERIDSLTPEQQAHFDFLTVHPDVLITPHIAGYSTEAFLKMSTILLQKLGF